MNFARPTVASTNGAVSSMSHSTVQQPLKSASTVKESSGSGTNGIPNHSASRATAKRGFFGRENGGGSASAAQSSVKASTAQLQTEKTLANEPSGRDSKTSKTNQPPRSSSKGKKKPAIKQPNALKAKRNSITGHSQNQYAGAYLTTETSQTKAAGGYKPQDSS